MVRVIQFSDPIWLGIYEATVGFTLAHIGFALFFFGRLQPTYLFYPQVALWISGCLYCITRLLKASSSRQDTSGCKDEKIPLERFDVIDSLGTGYVNYRTSFTCPFLSTNPNYTRARSHRFGTRSPFWFTRTWEGFEDEDEEWRVGQTSAIKIQGSRSALIRVLVVRKP